jgi:hypothetical protein
VGPQSNGSQLSVPGNQPSRVSRGPTNLMQARCAT